MNKLTTTFFKDNPAYVVSPSQIEILEHLENCRDFFKKSKWRRWLSPIECRGVYLYGPPGGGKTTLMQYFLENLEEKRHFFEHFHNFLFDFHRKMQDSSNGFLEIIHDFSKEHRILGLDEFFVDNIADAMILERFLREYKKNNVFVFLTSNTPPENLYLKGLHRDRFMGCIDFILENYLVLELSPNQDYRKHETWPEFHGANRITYHDLCEKPLGTREYMEMALEFDAIEIYDIPDLSDKNLDSLKRLTVCTDIFYMEKKRIRIGQEIIDKIYDLRNDLHGLERTASRLKSMMK